MTVQTQTDTNNLKLQGKGKKLIISVNVDWFFLSHRLPIALEAQKRGYEVVVMAEDTGDGKKIKELGLRFIPIPMVRSSTNIIAELKALIFFYKTYKKEKPDIIHHVAMKPVTYGSIVARFYKGPLIINALSGMGYLFADSDSRKLVKNLVLQLFKFAFNNPRLRFIFQNQDDLNTVLNTVKLSKSQCYMIRGSGVDLNTFRYVEEYADRPVRVLLPARMLLDKGVREFIDAARILKPKFEDKVEFIMAGNADTGNRTGISEEELLKLNQEGHVHWIGFQSDMPKVLEEAHIVCLPSYREGLPKSLIEAAAIGRPIVTTDVPGCRETVEDGKNGILVPVKDSKALAEAIEKLIIDKDLRVKMGLEGRKLAEQVFSLRSVLDKHFQIYEGTETPVG